MSGDYGKAPRRSGDPSGRSGPYDRPARQARDEELEQQMFETPANAVKVSAATDVRELANTIGAAISSHLEVPALLTIGHQSINQAIKGIAAAATDLKGSTDLTFQPAFRHENRTKPLIAFYLAHHRIVHRIDNGEEVELTATKNQKIVSLAGAIAGKVRELKRIHMIALGAEAVTNAVLAIGNARLFLEKDNMDIKVTPEFVKIMRSSGEMNAIRFNVVPERI